MEKEMKQYKKPDLYFIEIPKDLLTLSKGGEQKDGDDNITIDWSKL